jgi:hypothetical protein
VHAAVNAVGAAVAAALGQAAGALRRAGLLARAD